MVGYKILSTKLRWNQHEDEGFRYLFRKYIYYSDYTMRQTCHDGCCKTDCAEGAVKRLEVIYVNKTYNVDDVAGKSINNYKYKIIINRRQGSSYKLLFICHVTAMFVSS